MALAACEPATPTAEDFIPEYKGVKTVLLDGDLVQFNVAMTKARASENVAAYAECAAAQYALIRGYELHVMYAQMWRLRVAFGVLMLFTQSRRACHQA